jgi:hypothetical protein
LKNRSFFFNWGIILNLFYYFLLNFTFEIKNLRFEYFDKLEPWELILCARNWLFWKRETLLLFFFVKNMVCFYNKKNKTFGRGSGCASDFFFILMFSSEDKNLQRCSFKNKSDFFLLMISYFGFERSFVFTI